MYDFAQRSLPPSGCPCADDDAAADAADAVDHVDQRMDSMAQSEALLASAAVDPGIQEAVQVEFPSSMAMEVDLAPAARPCAVVVQWTGHSLVGDKSVAPQVPEQDVLAAVVESAARTRWKSCVERCVQIQDYGLQALGIACSC